MIAALETRAATVIVGRKTILAPLSLQFAQGETVALVGPNGAGKSTLLRLLAGELAPSSGWVGLRGTALADYSPQRLAQHRAMLSQSVAVAFPFTVAEVIAMGAGAAGTSGIEHLVAEALAEVDLADFGSRIVTTLSGGEQQRAHFARVLVQSRCGEALYGPGVLLLDEPTASLDLKHQLALATIARKRAAAGTTVVAVLHDLNLACLFADRIVVLDRGRVAADGPPRAVMTEALLADVFGVCGALGCVPADRPFVLPHGAAALPCGGAATSPNQMSPNQ